MMPVSWFRVVALAETISYLLLLGAVVAKRAFDHPAAVSVVGPLHGVIFLAYFVLVIFVREEQRWSAPATMAVLFAAVIPFGGYAVERRLVRNRPATPPADGARP